MAGKSINKVVLLGNLTRDPELKYTPNGTAVCTMGLATNRTWVAEGQTKEDVQYHRLTAWNKLAELCGKLLTKGKKIYVEGRIVYRTFTGKDGTQKSITEIVIDDFILLSGRAEGEYPSSPSDDDAASAPKSAQPAPEPDIDMSSSPEDEKINPDDIPF
jgi:single-strand DNA-binding protein